VYPCHPTVAVIEQALSSSFNISEYFEDYNTNANSIHYIVTEFSASKLAKATGEIELKIPFFRNTYDTLCPLSYKISSSNEQITAISELPNPDWLSQEYVKL
jgi:hypothetical protein